MSSQASDVTNQVPLECLVCAQPITILGAFDKCGHFLCYACALRIHSINKKGCPICREPAANVLITRQAPKSEDGFDTSTELSFARTPGGAVRDTRLGCLIEGNDLAEHVRKLYEPLCPFALCWNSGRQEPFVKEALLKEHLHVDHHVRQCPICLKHRPAFLSEQLVYQDKEYEQHLQGTCPKDATSFQGHPPCKFCSNERHYDGEHLFKHMQHAHFSCDVCNRGEFTFTYYKNREKLYEHFERAHKLCDHQDCSQLDPMLRVFFSDLELQAHKQRAHGVANRGVSLDALGFRFSYGNAAVSPSTAAASGAFPPPPATGANSHALTIRFDYVSRVEVVDTAPKSAEGRGKHHGGRSKPSGASGSSEGQQIHGVPSHYLRPDMRLQQVTVRSDAPAAPVPPNNGGSPKGSKSPVYPRGAVGERNTSSSSSGGVAAKDSFGSSSNTGSSPAAAAAVDLSGLNAAELSAAFEEKLRQLLPNPKTLAEFRFACGDFLSGKLLAVEYYDLMQRTFFAQRGQLDIIFPYLVATIPNAAKSEALKQVRQMRSAPELQRVQQVSEADEALARSRRAVNQALSAKAAKKGAWASTEQTTQGEAAPRASAAKPASPTTAADVSLPQQQHSNWGGRTVHNPAVVVPLPSTFVDPSDFPELPSSGRQRKSAGQTKPGPKGNAWFGGGSRK